MSSKKERLDSLTEVDITFIMEALLTVWRKHHFSGENSNGNIVICQRAKEIINKLDPLYNEREYKKSKEA